MLHAPAPTTPTTEESTSWFEAKAWSDWWKKAGAYKQAATPQEDIWKLAWLGVGFAFSAYSEIDYAKYTLKPTRDALLQIDPKLPKDTAASLATLFSTADATTCALMVGYLPGLLYTLREAKKKYTGDLKPYLLILFPIVIYSWIVGASSAVEGLDPKDTRGDIAEGVIVFLAQLYMYFMFGLTSYLTGSQQIKRVVDSFISKVQSAFRRDTTAEAAVTSADTPSANCCIKALYCLAKTIAKPFDNPYIVPETIKTLFGAIIRATGFGFIPLQWGKLFGFDMSKLEKHSLKGSSIAATLLMHFLTTAAVSIEAAEKKATYFRMTPEERADALTADPNNSTLKTVIEDKKAIKDKKAKIAKIAKIVSIVLQSFLPHDLTDKKSNWLTKLLEVCILLTPAYLNRDASTITFAETVVGSDSLGIMVASLLIAIIANAQWAAMALKMIDPTIRYLPSLARDGLQAVPTACAAVGTACAGVFSTTSGSEQTPLLEQTPEA